MFGSRKRREAELERQRLAEEAARQAAAKQEAARREAEAQKKEAIRQKYLPNQLVLRFIDESAAKVLQTVASLDRAEHISSVSCTFQLSAATTHLGIYQRHDRSRFTALTRVEFYQERYPNLPFEDTYYLAEILAEVIIKEAARRLDHDPGIKDTNKHLSFDSPIISICDFTCHEVKLYYTASNAYFRGMNQW